MPEPTALSVSAAMAQAKRALEGVQVRVVGEVSDLSDKPGYKAVYFTLADAGATMPCMMWRDAFAAAGVPLRCGMLVEVGGGFTLYAPKGRMQFTVRSLRAAGEGVLRVQVAELARLLEAEGLMRPERKRPMPAFPARIGLVTSPRGKAVHDVLRTLRRRYPVAEVVLAGVAVEGAGAVRDIVAGLRAVAASGVDAIVLGRGGGSYEDLMPFNAEEVARAVVSMPVPVVTGIGHEPDTTIADMVADLRASTPTAAAEAVAPAASEVESRFRNAQRLLGRGLAHNAQAARHRLRVLAGRPIFCEATALCALKAQTLDLAAEALARALPGVLTRDAARLDLAVHRLKAGGTRAYERAEERAGRMAARLEDLSPLAILARGYAVCFDVAHGRVVRSSAELGPGDRVRVRLGRGSAGCVVETTEEDT